MLRVLCDHCGELIRDVRKSYTFLAAKSGLLMKENDVEVVDLQDQEFYANNNRHVVISNHQHKIYCSKCMMELWGILEQFGNAFEEEGSK